MELTYHISPAWILALICVSYWCLAKGQLVLHIARCNQLLMSLRSVFRKKFFKVIFECMLEKNLSY